MATTSKRSFLARTFSTLGVSAAITFGTSQAFAAPAVLDRLPADSGPILAVSSLKTLDENAGQLMAAIEFRAADSISELLTVMGLSDGLDMNGSAAAVWPAGSSIDGDWSRLVMLIPTTPDGRFLKGLGGNEGDEVQRIDYNGATYYARAMEPALLAISPSRAIVSALVLEKGRAAARLESIGPRGREMADEADVMLIASGDSVKPLLDLVLTPIRQGIGAAGMTMGKPAAAAPQRMTEAFIERAAAQTQAAIVGIRAGPLGARVDLIAAFKEGGELSELTAGRHEGRDPLLEMPRHEYLLLATTDFTHPVFRAMLSDAALPAADPDADPATESQMLRLMQLFDSSAVAMYLPKGAIMTEGLLTNTIITWASQRPADGVVAFRRLLEVAGPESTGKPSTPEGGPGFSYTPRSLMLADTAIDTWSVWPDPAAGGGSNPLLTGQTPGMRGYVATTATRAYIMTGHNQGLLAQAIRPTPGQTFSDDLMLTQIAQMLPDRAAMRWFINLKPLLQQMAPMIRMMTGAPIELPDELPPIAGAIAMEERSMHAGLFLPAPLLKVASTLYRAQQGAAP